jgi:O-antigen/teichoic acid export membrane protein
MPPNTPISVPVNTSDALGSLVQRARALLRLNAVLVKNSGAVAIGNGSTAVLGFAYWWVAARFMPPDAVGIASALVSTMGLIGQLGEGGIATLLMGQMSVHGQRRDGLIAASGVMTMVSCFSLALLSMVGAGIIMPERGFFASGLFIPALLLGGCAATGVASVIDHAFVGLFLSKFLMYRNMVFSVTKMLLLAAVLLLLGLNGTCHFGGDVATLMLSWILGIIVSGFAIAGLAISRGAVRLARPDFRLLLSLLPTFLSHHLLNMLTLAPALAMPMVVSMLISPAAAAAFYAVWMILIIAFAVPGALTNVLYTVGASNPLVLAERLQFSLLASLGFSALVSVVFYFFAYPILWLFNPFYAQIAASSLQLLGLTLLTGTIRYHYLAIVRVHNRMRQASVVLAFSGVVSLACAIYGGWTFGLRGLVIGWILAGFAEAAFMAPTVVKAGWPNARATLRSTLRAER